MINLPVKVEPMVGNDRQPPWEIHEADGSDIALCYTMEDATEIARRINAHDALVEALEKIRDKTAAFNGEVFYIAAQALAAAKGGA